MDVTIASLNAVAAHTVDPEWTPKIGELFVRFHVSPTKMEVEFCVADNITTTGSAHCFTIARIYHWRGEAAHSSFIDCVKGESGTTFTGAAIVRRYVTDSDLDALEKLWDDRTPFAVWLRGVLSNMAISESSRDFIRETLVSRQGRMVSDG